MRRELAYLLTFTVMVPGEAYALGLGNIESRPALNEPFEATIELIGAQAEVHYGTSPPAVSSYSGGDTYGPTVHGDTLWSIATQVRPDRWVSIQQVLVALLRANPGAFRQDNMNGLKPGLVLHIPDKAAITAVSKAEAREQVQRYQDLWEQYRQALASSPTQPPLGVAPSQEELETQATPLVPEEDETRLELVSAAREDVSSRQTAPGPGRESQVVDSLRDELALVKEELEAKRRESSELNEKLTEADELIRLLQRQIEVKNNELAALQAKLAGVQPPPSSLEALSETGMPAEPASQPVEMAAETKQMQEPEAVPKTLGKASAPVEPKPESILDKVPGGAITFLAGLILLVLGSVAALVSFLVRGRQERATAVDETLPTITVEDAVTKLAERARTAVETGTGETLAIGAMGAAAAATAHGGLDFDLDLGAKPKTGGYGVQDMLDLNGGGKEEERADEETEVLDITAFDEDKAELPEVGPETSDKHRTDEEGEIILDLTDSGIDEEIQDEELGLNLSDTSLQTARPEKEVLEHIETMNFSTETSEVEGLSFDLDLKGKDAKDLFLDIAEEVDTSPPDVGSLSIEIDKESLDEITRSLENPVARASAYRDTESRSETSESLETLRINQDLPEWENAAERTVSIPATEGAVADEEIDTKLNLARVYLEPGDSDGAHSILNEVVQQGTEEQQKEVRQLLRGYLKTS